MENNILGNELIMEAINTPAGSLRHEPLLDNICELHTLFFLLPDINY